MRRFVLLVVIAGPVLGIVARAQSEDCEHPVKDLASCPPCPSSTQLCRKPVDGYQPTVNGCGPEKFSKLIKFGVIPQGYGDANFSNGGCPSTQSCGCNQHDRCYGTCNKDKKACDDAFRQELLKSCDNTYPVDPRGRAGCSDGLCFSNNEELGICYARANKYYNLVAGLGQSAYDDAQKDACQCCCNPQGSAMIAADRASLVNQAGPVCRPPKLQGTTHHHKVQTTGDDQVVTDSVATLDMPFDPGGSSSDVLNFISVGSYHFHYQETKPNCTVTAPDIDGTLGSEAENGGIGVWLAPDNTHVAGQYQGTVGAIFDLPVTYNCGGNTQVITYTWPEEFFINVTQTNVLDGGTGTGNYEIDQPGITQTFDWTFHVSGL
jgi:hypothetical protein